MKKLIRNTVMVAMVFGMTTTMAQKGEEKQKLTPEQKSEKVADRMAKNLNLDAAQKASVKSISLKHAKKRHELKAEMKVLRKKMKTQKKIQHEEIRKVLTPEQIKKMEELKAKRDLKRSEKRKKKHRGEHKGEHKLSK
jgi:hypothetical protein